MKPEVLFLKYAFPCSMGLMQRGKITQKILDKLERSAINNGPIERELLESIYTKAIRRMKDLAKEKNKDYFSEEIIRQYFTKRHNELLEGKVLSKDEEENTLNNKIPPTLKHLCMVFKSKVIKKEQNYYVVEYYDKNVRKTRSVLNSLLPDANIGDMVTIHYGYAIEKWRK